MLEDYDRVIPSRSIPTLVALCVVVMPTHSMAFDPRARPNSRPCRIVLRRFAGAACIFRRAAVSAEAAQRWRRGRSPTLISSRSAPSFRQRSHGLLRPAMDSNSMWRWWGFPFLQSASPSFSAPSSSWRSHSSPSALFRSRSQELRQPPRRFAWPVPKARAATPRSSRRWACRPGCAPAGKSATPSFAQHSRRLPISLSAWADYRAFCA